MASFWVLKKVGLSAKYNSTHSASNQGLHHSGSAIAIYGSMVLGTSLLIPPTFSWPPYQPQLPRTRIIFKAKLS